MFCYNCGKQIEDSAAFCVFCGADQREEDVPVVESVPQPTAFVAPATPVAPAAPVEVASPIPQLVAEPVQSVTPAQPVTPAAPVAPEMSTQPMVSTAPIVPDIPDVPEVPCAPAVPVVAHLSEEPVAPATPVQPVAPAVSEEPTKTFSFAVNSPEIEEVPAAPAAPVAPAQPVAPAAPAAPVAPAQPVAPAAPAAPVAPAQPVAPVAPVAPAQPVAPATIPEELDWQPMTELSEEEPRKKKTWIIWVVLAVVVLLAAAGTWLYFQWQGENAHKEALTNLMTVAVEGDFSKIETLAPMDYWDKAGVDKAKLAGSGEIWLKEVLPELLQESFKKQSDVHYKSFSISPDPEIVADQAVDEATKKELTTVLQANYGITEKRITDVRYMEIHISLSGTVENMEHTSFCKEELFMVQMGDYWYPVTIAGRFAVERIVEPMRPKLEESETGKQLSNLSPNKDATTTAASTKKTAKKPTKTTKK